MKKLDRRNFVKTAAVFGGGMMFGSNIVRAQGKAEGDAKPLNIALIGFGAQGRVLYENLMKLPNIRWKAVCDLRAPLRKYVQVSIKRALKQEVAGYEDYKEMIAKEKDLDAVFIATPDIWHSPMTCDCLEAGINVYCEKMMSNTKEGARKMVKAMQKTGKLLQIGHQRKSNPRYIYAHDHLIRGAQVCGTLTGATGQWNRSVTTDIEAAPLLSLPQEKLEQYGYKDMKQFLNWRWYEGFGCGPISDLGSHQIDIFEWFFGGRPKSVMAAGGVDYYTDKDWFDNVMCIFEYETFQKKVARAFYQVQTTTGAGGGYYEMFMGTEGSLKMSENPAITKIFREPSDTLNPKWEGYLNSGIIRKPAPVTKPPADDDPDPDLATADSRESPPLAEFRLPKSLFAKVRTRVLDKNSKGEPMEITPHLPHVINFLDSIRGLAKLNCDGAMAFEAEAAVFKAIDAIKAKKTLTFEESDFVA